MKKIIVSLSIMAMVAGVVIGATSAYFSDTETSVGNTFTAGTLDLKIDKDPDGSVFDWVNDDDSNFPVMNNFWDLSNLKPGDSMRVIAGINNTGSVDGLANIGLKNLVDADNTLEEPETAGSGELSANVDVVVSYGDKSVIGDAWETWTSVWTGTLLEWSNLGANIDAIALLGVGVADVDTDYWVIDFSIDSSVGNDIMTDTATFDIEFGLVQQP
jgi:predicted ribosomally synthesized peptide with SipW-like signal peptide